MSGISARFWSKVDVRDPDDCWEWQACRGWAGYGMFGIDGIMRTAPRVAWTLANDAIPEGMCVLHKCDNPPCVNPAHLFLGTQADNVADTVQKERQARGEDLPQSKLAEADVVEIRIRYRAGGVSQRALAREFSVSQENIGYIVRGDTWRHLLGKDTE